MKTKMAVFLVVVEVDETVRAEDIQTSLEQYLDTGAELEHAGLTTLVRQAVIRVGQGR